MTGVIYRRYICVFIHLLQIEQLESKRKVQTPSCTQTSATTTLPEITPPPKKRKPQKSKDKDFVNVLQKICADERDANDAFGEFVAKSLQKVGEDRARELRKQIFDILN